LIKNEMFYFFDAVVPVSWKTQTVHDCFENAGLVMVNRTVGSSKKIT